MSSDTRVPLVTKMVEGIEKTFLVLLRWVLEALRGRAVGHVSVQLSAAGRLVEAVVRCVPRGIAWKFGKLPDERAFREAAVGQFVVIPSVPFFHRGNFLCEQWVPWPVRRIA